jgi:hypothetical protein
MKQSFIILFFFFIIQYLSAQEFEVREFKHYPNDIRARRNEKKSVNGDPCAIIHVITNIRNMQFESNFIVDVEVKDDGYWIWLAPNERSIRLMHRDFISLDVSLPRPAASYMFYDLIVARKGVLPPTTDLVQITFRLNQSDVMISSGNMAPVQAPGSTAVRFVPRGQHNFRFSKQGFRDEELDINVQEEQTIDVNLTPGETTTTLSLPGFIMIESTPSEAEVFLNDQRVGSTPYQGRHIAGSYTLMLRYPLFHEHTESFNLSEGATVSLPPVNLKPRFGYWQVTSTPSGAAVYLDDRMMGTTPLSRAEIGSGTHELKVRKDLYREHQETFTIADGDDKTFNISLNPAFGQLKITSEPTGAKVFIEGREVGTTPYENLQLASGTLNVRLSMELYSDAREQIIVRDGETTDRFIALTRNFGTLKVNAADAEIFIDNSRVATGSHTANLPPGRYKVKAIRNLHHDDELDVSIIVGETTEITLTPRPRQGALVISSQPFETRGAEIFINDRKRSETTPASFPLLIGSYKVSVKKPGYLDATRQLEILEGQEHEMVFNMQTFEGSMLQKARRHKTAKIIYGSATIAAAGAGAYFRYSAMTLADDYKTATTDANTIYNRYEQHDLYSYIAFGAAVPLGILTIVKASQQKKARRQANVAFVPVQGGGVLSLRVGF